ncbi:unnamed protein product [Coccothraustes coccothraustes]
MAERAPGGGKKMDFGMCWTVPRVQSCCCCSQNLPGFGAIPVLDTPQADDPWLPKLRAPASAALAGREDEEKTRRRSRGAAALPLLGSGFNYLPAKLEQGFVLGKSLSN